MVSFQGKSGSDAIYNALHRICLNINKYEVKLRLAVALAQSSGNITAPQASAVYDFIDAAHDLCEIMKAVAENSGFSA